jgi:hypothetical protein
MPLLRSVPRGHGGWPRREAQPTAGRNARPTIPWAHPDLAFDTRRTEACTAWGALQAKEPLFLIKYSGLALIASVISEKGSVRRGTSSSSRSTTTCGSSSMRALPTARVSRLGCGWRGRSFSSGRLGVLE